MATPSVKQLEAFWWAATCSNFSTAAERLHLSVSSLSKRISELEGALGQALFDRTGHKAVLTESGRRLLPAALRVLNAVADLGRSLAETGALSGHCRFGVGDLSALTWLPALVAGTRRLHPGLTLEACVDVGGVLERRLAEGELDFAVIAGRSSRSALVSQSVGAARFAWAASPHLAVSSAASVAGLLERCPLITLPPQAGTTRLLDDWLLAQGLAEPRERIQCNSWAAVAGMLREGVGVGFLPEGWIDGLGLCRLEVEPELGALQYAFQWRRGDARSLVPVMQGMVSSVLDFSLLPCLAGAAPLAG